MDLCSRTWNLFCRNLLPALVLGLLLFVANALVPYAFTWLGQQLGMYRSYEAAMAYQLPTSLVTWLLAKKREIRKLESESQQRGVTLIPLAIYFKNGRAKVEIGVARGKQQHDKRETIKRKEAERELRRATMQRR